MKNRIVLVQPMAKFHGSDADKVPPYALLYIGSALKRAGYKVDLYHGSDLDEMHKIIGRGDDVIFVGFSAFTGEPVVRAAEMAREVDLVYPDIFKILGGYHASTMPLQSLLTGPFDCIVKGEGEEVAVEIANLLRDYDRETALKYMGDILGLTFYDNDGEVRSNCVREYSDNIDYDIDWSLVDLDKYVHSVGHLGGKNYFYIFSSRGCPYNCLSGNTEINTVDGMIKIKDLVGRDNIGVYTYDVDTGRALISDAYNITKTQENAELVRVIFDDDSFIDCTPDHRFLTFKNGNQFVGGKEEFVEAKDLKYKQRVRAIKSYETPQGYIDVYWKRRGRDKQHRMVAEYMLGESLGDRNIHHIDGDKSNNCVDNIEIYDTMEAHFKNHPEIAERMKIDNPAFDMNDEWRRNISNGCSGFIRSDESKGNYRDSKLGSKNPNYIDGKHSELNAFCSVCGIKISRGYNKCRNCYRLDDVNHKVKNVIYLDRKEDVYCMEVPRYHAFYANNVLVHNCSFCAGSYLYNRRYRKESANHVVETYKWIVDKYEVDLVEYLDDNFFVDLEWAEEVATKIGRPYRALIRADRINEEVCDLLNRTNCRSLFMGIESGNDRVRNEVMEKGITSDQIRVAVKMMAERCPQINITTMFIMGVPGETYEEYRDTARFAIELTDLHPKLLTQANVYAPYPRCKSYLEAIKLGWAEPNHIHEWTMDSKPGSEIRPIWLKWYNGSTMMHLTLTGIMFMLLRRDDGFSGIKKIAKSILRASARFRLKYDIYAFATEMHTFWLVYKQWVKKDRGEMNG